jgi:hypothetical protein
MPGPFGITPDPGWGGDPPTAARLSVAWSVRSDHRGRHSEFVSPLLTGLIARLHVVGTAKKTEAAINLR